MLSLSLIERFTNLLFGCGVIAFFFGFYYQTIFYFHWRAYQRRTIGYISPWLSSFALFLPHLPEECRRDRRRLLWSLAASVLFGLLTLPGLDALRQAAAQ
jgi:hypothetical protein